MEPGRDQLGLWDREQKPLPITRNTRKMARRRAHEGQARDQALLRLHEAREHLIAAAKDVARRIAKDRNRVTSVEVLATMHEDPELHAEMARHDPRWVGCVFRGPEWRTCGWEREGSHRRPVRVWQYCP